MSSSLHVVLQCPHCRKGLQIPGQVVRLLQAEGGAAAVAASSSGIGLEPGVEEDLREVEDHFRRMKNLMLKLIDKYGNQPGDDAISDHIRRAHEDLQLKLVIASTRKAIVAEDELVMHEAPPAIEVSDVDEAPPVEEMSEISNDTVWYPDDPCIF
jgi:hypothetical protein